MRFVLGPREIALRGGKSMSASYFRQKAAQSYRRARLLLGPEMKDNALMRIGHEFKAKAVVAAARLARMRDAALKKQEVERQAGYWDSRE
jgi:hypothetical protein